MNIYGKIIADSISDSKVRIVTLEISLPKVLLAEFNTHRVFSRNFSSSRAIPVSRVTTNDSFVPLKWGKNQPGMQAKNEELSGDELVEAKKIWMDAIQYCKNASARLNELGLHKQWSNRLNDWHTMAKGIVTSTEWDNFFELRDHEDAQPEIRLLAQEIKASMMASTPVYMNYGSWHLPYITDEERSRLADDKYTLQHISAARCARVSYMKHDGTKSSLEEDFALCEKLAGSNPKHYSPFEHQATPMMGPTAFKFSGNLRGWTQYRKIHEFISGVKYASI